MDLHGWFDIDFSVNSESTCKWTVIYEAGHRNSCRDSLRFVIQSLMIAIIRVLRTRYETAWALKWTPSPMNPTEYARRNHRYWSDVKVCCWLRNRGVIWWTRNWCFFLFCSLHGGIFVWKRQRRGPGVSSGRCTSHLITKDVAMTTSPRTATNLLKFEDKYADEMSAYR